MSSSAALVQSVRAHGGEVTCADVLGARLVTGGGDRVLRAWRWTRGEGWSLAAERPRAHRYTLTAARWSNSGLLVASAGVDGCVRLWTTELQPRAEVAAPRAVAVRALCWASGRLCAGHDDGAISVWRVGFQKQNVESEEERGVGNVWLEAIVEAHTGALHSLCAPAQGALLMAACTEGVLKVFDMTEVCRRGTDDGPLTPLLWEDGAHDLGALCAAVSRCGRLAATGGHDAKIRVWSVSRRSVRAAGTLAGHAAAVTALAWGGAGDAGGKALLASAALDRTARVWLRGVCTRVVHAHSRYLTCVLLAPDESFMITGSNDKTVRMWSLNDLTIEDIELEQPCDINIHFGLGDLEGIDAVDEEQLLSESRPGTRGGVRREFSVRGEGGAVNCIAAVGDILATALSDGKVRMYRYTSASASLELVHTCEGHEYPATSVSFSSDGRVLLSAGLDGTARLWDVETGVQTRLLSVPTARDEMDTGGGGIRDARLYYEVSHETKDTHVTHDLVTLDDDRLLSSESAPLRVLLATDDGFVPLWKLEDEDPAPAFVLEGQGSAAWCCAWCGGARGVGAAGGERGELRVFCARHAEPLHTEHEAHDLGVQSCDFAPTHNWNNTDNDETEYCYLLATGGCDGLIKLWDIRLYDEASGERVSMQLVRQMEAHGGGVACVRWQRGGVGEREGVLASGGADRWARVWHVRGNKLALLVALRHQTTDEEVGEEKEHGKGGVTSVCLLEEGVLAAGTLDGELALWSIRTGDAGDEGGAGGGLRGAGERCWGVEDTATWLRDYVTRVPGSRMTAEEEAEMLQLSRAAAVDGAALLDAPIHDLLLSLHLCHEDSDDQYTDDARATREETRKRLVEEVEWLRRDPLTMEQELAAPHWARCTASHRVMRDPTRASDGFTYERAALLDAFLAAEGAVSPVSGRAVRGAAPNHRLRVRIQQLYHSAPDL